MAASANPVTIALKTEPIDIFIVDHGGLDGGQLLSLRPSVRGFIINGVNTAIASTSDHLDVVIERDLDDAITARTPAPPPRPHSPPDHP